jgi:VanZ family protein
MYAGFTFASIWGYRKPFKENGDAYRWKAVWIAILIGIVYGALTEVMQETLIPGRTGSVYDWIADTIGSILGAIIAYFLLRDRNNLKNEALDK